MRLLTLIIALAAAPPIIRTEPSASTQCDYDKRILELGFEAFDQDMKGGWRPLANRDGCKDKVADLIRDYRVKYQSIIPLLYWHEGQMRAFAGHSQEAIALMQQSRFPEEKDRLGWNVYVDATVAFLRNDRTGLLQGRDRLKNIARPVDWPPNAEWPQNARFIEAFLNCFGKPYKIAYSAVRPPRTRHWVAAR